VLGSSLVLLALPTQGKDIVVFRFIIEYSSFRDFGPWVIIDLFLYEDLKKKDDDVLARLC
jgi:hypothetical protein